MLTTVMLVTYRVQNNSAPFYTCLCYSYRREGCSRIFCVLPLYLVFQQQCNHRCCPNQTGLWAGAYIPVAQLAHVSPNKPIPQSYVGYFVVCAMANFFHKSFNTCLQHAEAKVYDKASEQLFALINLGICGLTHFGPGSESLEWGFKSPLDNLNSRN